MLHESFWDQTSDGRDFWCDPDEIVIGRGADRFAPLPVFNNSLLVARVRESLRIWDKPYLGDLATAV